MDTLNLEMEAESVRFSVLDRSIEEKGTTMSEEERGPDTDENWAASTRA